MEGRAEPRFGLADGGVALDDLEEGPAVGLDDPDQVRQKIASGEIHSEVAGLAPAIAATTSTFDSGRSGVARSSAPRTS